MDVNFNVSRDFSVDCPSFLLNFVCHRLERGVVCRGRIFLMAGELIHRISQHFRARKRRILETIKMVVSTINIFNTSFSDPHCSILR